MKCFKASAHARVGLLGNPSDGYFGKTISAIVKNFSARVSLHESPALEITLRAGERCQFEGIEHLVQHASCRARKDGLALIKAAIKVFARHCRRHGVVLPRQNFSLRFESDIPRQVGLGGSSAIVVAVLRALMRFYQVNIPRQVLPNLALLAETREMGIEAGLQDRVCQVYEGLVFMDFERTYMRSHGHAQYEPMDARLLPPLYLAYESAVNQTSDIYHSRLRRRWEKGDVEVKEAIRIFAELAEEGKQSLLNRDYRALAELINRNFDTRSKLVRLRPGNVAMVKLARRLGVCAKYAGSGGSIVGICEREEKLSELEEEFSRIGCVVLRLRVLQEPCAVRF